MWTPSRCPASSRAASWRRSGPSCPFGTERWGPPRQRRRRRSDRPTRGGRREPSWGSGGGGGVVAREAVSTQEPFRGERAAEEEALPGPAAVLQEEPALLLRLD